MGRNPLIWGLHAEPPRVLSFGVGLLPFILLCAVYLTASHARLADNPQDKLLPSPQAMVAAMTRMMTEPDTRSGEYLFFLDTLASVRRIAAGVFLAGVAGLLLGVNTSLFPGLRALVLPVLTAAGKVPPLALLPILFISVGIGEEAKIVLIFIGIVFSIALDTCLAVDKIPHEQIVKVVTLGASELGAVYRVVTPQIIPRLLDTMRLSLGPAWLFLIASEAIASAEGLGYRIFLVRRYLAMEIIIPYVLWITLLAFLFDLSLRLFVRAQYPWYVHGKGA